MQQETPEPSKKIVEYLITEGQNEQRAVERQDAVRMAKELSQASRRPVDVKRSDGAVHMRFRAGQLESLVYQARDRR